MAAIIITCTVPPSLDAEQARLLLERRTASLRAAGRFETVYLRELRPYRGAPAWLFHLVADEEATGDLQRPVEELAADLRSRGMRPVVCIDERPRHGPADDRAPVLVA